MWGADDRGRNRFGMQLASTFPSWIETMKALIDESRTLYAAIQACSPDGHAERFVISYTSERALRDLLARPSILASGCTTRERAEELCRGEIPMRVWSQQDTRSASAFLGDSHEPYGLFSTEMSAASS
jgi:hypothetical protein